MNNQNPKPYPAYKPSGIPWLGDIPAHWEVVKSKSLFKEIIDKNHPKETLLSVTQENGVLPRTDSEIRVWNPGDDVTGYKLILPGDFVISLRSFQGGIELSNVKGIVSPAYIVLRRKLDIIDGYYKYWLKSKLFISVLSVFTTGIRQGKTISYDDFKEIPSLVPPLPEQQAIAAYLDGETARLDAVIAAYRRLLALLDEKRRALITHAVTRGLNPTVPLKPSGIPWLGDIPAHWIFDRAKFIFRKMSRPTREEDDVVTAFRDGTVTLRSNRRTEGFTFSIKEIGYQGVRKGDLVIHQMDGFAGAIGVSDSDGKCTPIYSICTPIIPAITHYYGYLLRHMAKSDFILSLAKGIRERSSDFRFDVFRELVLPIPPLPEQQAIAAYLDQETTRLDGLKTKIETLLARLAEYRAALISAAVTGKMDVRDAAFETIQ